MMRFCEQQLQNSEEPLGIAGIRHTEQVQRAFSKAKASKTNFVKSAIEWYPPKGEFGDIPFFL